MEIPIQNIYYLLCYAWNKLEERDIVDVKSVDTTNLADLFAKVLISGVTHLLKRGIDRNYIGFHDELQTLRGKVDFPTTISRNLIKRARAQCYFDELDHDILHNQILKKTIYNLILVDELNDKLRDELIRVYRYFYKISDVKISQKAFKSVRLNRNNYFYSFLLNICELIYENLLPSEDKGKTRFRDFLRDEKQMAYLFEEFVRNFYRIEQKEFKVTREDIKWKFIGSEEAMRLLPKMQTDISLISSDRKIIIDAKYYKEALKLNFDSEKLNSSNLYQINSYLSQIEDDDEISRNATGVLLYPTNRQDLNLNYKYKTHTISIRTIDLNKDWKEIHKNLLTIIN